MESNFFRRLAAELGPALEGARVDKVFRPAADAWTLRLDRSGPGKYLLLRHGRGHPCCFLSAHKPDNPERPDAGAMWLRKRLAGRRLLQWSADWPGRRLAWALSGEPLGHLVLDLRQGPQVADELDPAFGADIIWPGLERVLGDPKLWRDYPHVTPPLKRVLADLARKDPNQAQDLYIRVQRGQADAFFVYLPARDASGGPEHQPGQALVWQREVAEGEREVVVDSALEAASLACQGEVFGTVRRQAEGPEADAAKARRKRLKNALAKVDQEEARMRELAACRDKGIAVQSALAAVRSSDKLERVTGMGPDGRDMAVDLDKRHTVAENMQRLFKLAAKGERGLAHAAERRAELAAELDNVEQGRWTAPQAEARPSRVSRRFEAAKNKDFSRFVSSDGFTLLRGKNAKANAKLLREAAAPFDLWFHAQDGPGSHVLLKRDHAGQEPPETSLMEAAVLAALKSWQAGEARGRVMCAEVKDVKPLKGAPPGTVKVDRVRVSLAPDLDPALEERLAVKPGSGRASGPLDAGRKKR